MTSRTLWSLAVVAAIAGCNSDPSIAPTTGTTGGSGGSGGPGSTGGNGSGGSGTGGSGTGGSSSTTGGSGGSQGGVRDSAPPLPPLPTWGDAGVPGSGSDAAEMCAATSAKAEPVPVDIHIMFDRSTSMLGVKWDGAKAAVTAFVQSPTTVGLAVGLAFFPATTAAGGIGTSCNVADYATPVVPIEVLPGVGMKIIDTLNMTMLLGTTPTLPALNGALMYARTWEMTKMRRVAVVLVTDGIPNGCASNVMNVAAAARAAAGMGLFTFVVGVGPMLMDLNTIAMAGGTTMAYLVDGGNAAQLIDALKDIQTRAGKLACTFNLPPPPGGQELDPDKVNVKFSPTGDPMTAVLLPRVANRAACGPMGGWFYDNPLAPTRVTLCDVSCMMANSSPTAELSLQFGCKGIQ